MDWTAKQHAETHYKAINLFNIVLIVYFVLIHAYSKNVECMLFFFFLFNKRSSHTKRTHIYVFDFLELVLQVFGELVRALYRAPLTGQAV